MSEEEGPVGPLWDIYVSGRKAKHIWVFIVLGRRRSLSSVAAKGRLDPGMVVIDNQSGYENENGRRFPWRPTVQSF